MDKEELKKKIVDILVNCKSDECAIEYCSECDGNPCIENCREKQQADALIAAGYRDVKEAELERKAYEVASNQYRIWFEEQKDRAEVAEKALDLCETAYILSLNHRATEGISGQAIASDLGVHKFFIKQAKKGLAEEGKDD